MLSMQYSHRLPADYDPALIRQRAARNGPPWDDTPGLGFKAFVLRERGGHGADGHVYASVYLWLDERAATDFIVGERFQNVIEGFGRPAVETWLPLAARAAHAPSAGHDGIARTLYREDLAVAEGADRRALRADEVRRQDDLLERPDTVAVVTSLDVANWRLLRLILSSAEPDATRAGIAYEVLHLARPGLARLAQPRT
jgi:hypothetical protein